MILVLHFSFSCIFQVFRQDTLNHCIDSFFVMSQRMISTFSKALLGAEKVGSLVKEWMFPGIFQSICPDVSTQIFLMAEIQLETIDD